MSRVPPPVAWTLPCPVTLSAPAPDWSSNRSDGRLALANRTRSSKGSRQRNGRAKPRAERRRFRRRIGSCSGPGGGVAGCVESVTKGDGHALVAHRRGKEGRQASCPVSSGRPCWLASRPSASRRTDDSPPGEGSTSLAKLPAERVIFATGPEVAKGKVASEIVFLVDIAPGVGAHSDPSYNCSMSAV